MSRARFAWVPRVALAAVVGSIAAAAPLSAQGGEGFLFRQPKITLKFETGYSVQAATGDVLDHTRSRYSVGWRDLDSPYIGGEVAYRATERWDVSFGVGLTDASVDSEDLVFIGTDDLPIEQVTELRVIPVTVGAKYYLNDRGRRISRFAWVPNRLAPYVGASVGFASYRFQQWGDFVDEETLDIYFDRLVSEGEGALMRGLAGATLSLGKQFELSGEARYTFASAEMSRNDFSQYGPIDLGGFQAVIGIAARF